MLSEVTIKKLWKTEFLDAIEKYHNTKMGYNVYAHRVIASYDPKIKSVLFKDLHAEELKRLRSFKKTLEKLCRKHDFATGYGIVDEYLQLRGLDRLIVKVFKATDRKLRLVEKGLKKNIRSRLRIPREISIYIIIILHLFNGKSESLSQLRIDFESNGPIEKEVLRRLNQSKKMILESQFRHVPTTNDIFAKEYFLIKNYQSQWKLFESRGDRDLKTQWANHWKDHLTKSLFTKDHEKILKSLNKEQKTKKKKLYSDIEKLLNLSEKDFRKQLKNIIKEYI